MSMENYAPGELRYKIILIGDAGTGKSSIFWRYINNEALTDRLVTTIDFRYKNIQVQEKQVKLCIWDTAGQEKFRCIVATYFKSCDGVVLVFDMSNPNSWDSIKAVWYDMASKRVPNASFMLLGSKKDLDIAVNLQEVNEWCASKGIYFIQTSAKTGEHIEQAFFTLAALISCTKPEEASLMSSFATSYTSTKHSFGQGMERVKSGGAERGPLGRGVQGGNAVSFYLKKQSSSKIKKEKCCN